MYTEKGHLFPQYNTHKQKEHKANLTWKHKRYVTHISSSHRGNVHFILISCLGHWKRLTLPVIHKSRNLYHRFLCWSMSKLLLQIPLCLHVTKIITTLILPFISISLCHLHTRSWTSLFILTAALPSISCFPESYLCPISGCETQLKTHLEKTKTSIYLPYW